MRSVVIEGDLSGLSHQQLLGYYKEVCEAVGVDYRTKPFGFYRDKRSGKISLYAEKACAEQLARKHNIGIDVIRKIEGNDMPMCVVTAVGIVYDANGRPGRKSTDIGVVPLYTNKFVDHDHQDPSKEEIDAAAASGRPLEMAYGKWGRWETRRLMGNEWANAIMKCVTKAKRRLVLSMCGLGMTDETELGTMEAEVVTMEEVASD